MPSKGESMVIQLPVIKGQKIITTPCISGIVW